MKGFPKFLYCMLSRSRTLYRSFLLGCSSRDFIPVTWRVTPLLFVLLWSRAVLVGMRMKVPSNFVITSFGNLAWMSLDVLVWSRCWLVCIAWNSICNSSLVLWRFLRIAVSLLERALLLPFSNHPATYVFSQLRCLLLQTSRPGGCSTFESWRPLLRPLIFWLLRGVPSDQFLLW